MDNVFNHQFNLMQQLYTTIDVIAGSGIRVPIKSRDAREPGRLKKMKTERRYRQAFTTALGRQLNNLYLTYKTPKPVINPLEDDAEFMKELLAITVQAMQGGIELFAAEVLIGMDWSLTNMHALRAASTYTYDLVRGIDARSASILRNAVIAFTDTPGYTLGDIARAVSPYFGEYRANVIATTETTRAYAEGQMQAGRDLQKEFPDVKVYKTWFTNNDDRVCEICGPLDGMSVDLEGYFPGAEYAPPAHVSCRCFLEYNTSLD